MSMLLGVISVKTASHGVVYVIVFDLGYQIVVTSSVFGSSNSFMND